MRRSASILVALLLVAADARAAAGEPARRDALLESAEAHHAVVELSEAARDWEAFARQNLADTRSPEVQTRAALLRILLGQDREAALDAGEIQHIWGHKHPALVARVGLALARSRADHEAWDDARAALAQAAPVVSAGASIETRAEVEALLGRTFSALGRTREAIAAHRSVLGLAKQGKAAAKRGAAEWDEPARDAVAESRFFFAEQARLRAEAVKLAPYVGSSERKPVFAYINTVAAPWATRRRAAIEEAVRAYASVLGIEIPPPRPAPRWDAAGGDPNAPTAALGDDPLLEPRSGGLPSIRWAIAAADRVGSLWAEYSHTLAVLPIPRALPGAEEISAEYRSTIDWGDSPYPENAKRAFELGAQLSRKYRIVDEHSRACEAWLSAHYRMEFRSYDELVPTPTLTGPALIAAPIRHDH